VINIYRLCATLIFFIFINGCATKPDTPVQKAKVIQDIQIYTSPNSEAKITTRSIESAFNSVGLTIVSNNDMNRPFLKRFKKLHHRVYNLAMFQDKNLTYRLVKRYPEFALLTPLTMSIWSDKQSINISTLTLYGISRAAKIPLDDPDLIEYSQKIKTALALALPNGHFKELSHKTIPHDKSLATHFVCEVNLTNLSSQEYIEDFEAEFEGELEPLGFLVPNFTNLNEEIFQERGYALYDYFHTYSLCKFDVIYPVSKNHPEAGAWAPCSFYLYKKKGEDRMYMGFLSVENWIDSMDIKERDSLESLRSAQGMIEKVITEITE